MQRTWKLKATLMATVLLLLSGCGDQKGAELAVSIGSLKENCGGVLVIISKSAVAGDGPYKWALYLDGKKYDNTAYNEGVIDNDYKEARIPLKFKANSDGQYTTRDYHLKVGQVEDQSAGETLDPVIFDKDMEKPAPCAGK